MHPDYLFLRRCEQIVKLARRHDDEIAMLDIAGILRQFFLDAHPLVNTVKRETKLKLRFISNRDDYDEEHAPQPSSDGYPPIRLAHPTFSVTMGAIDAVASNLPQARRATFNIDQFLRHAVARINGAPITVRMLIKLAANINGGVHYDANPTDPDMAVFGTFGRDQEHDDRIISLFSAQIVPIANVFLRGLAPLIALVKQRNPPIRATLEFRYRHNT